MHRALVALLVSVALLSGCLGGGSVHVASDTPLTTDENPSPTDDGNKTERRRVVNNFYHTHNMWGDRNEVYLFKEQKVLLGENPNEETRQYHEGNVEITIIGYRCFDTTIDGKVSDPYGERADAVFQGAASLRVTVDWTAVESEGERMPGLTFTYKHATTRLHEPVKDIPKASEFSIPIGPRMADMAHTDDVSRWRFCLEAYDDESPVIPGANKRVMAAKGTATITIKVVRGTALSIDDPHPLYFLDSNVIYAGEINKTSLKAKAFELPKDTVPEPMRRQGDWDRLFGWQVQNNFVIPWDAHTVKVWMWYNYTGPLTVAKHRLQLQYSDASDARAIHTPVPKTQRDLGTAGEELHYEIAIKGTGMADDAYAEESDWRWGVRPVIENDPERGGDFEGDVHILVLAEGDDSAYLSEE